jgi:hypothetical protein
MKLTTQLAALVLAPLAAAHFNLDYPPSLGFDEDIEGTSPCGGFPIAFSDSDTQVQVDGFPVALVAGHPAAQVLIRGTLNQSAPFTWVDLLPVVAETGLNNFCIPDVVAPSSWAGKPGLVQVEYDGPDGPLFQVSTSQCPIAAIPKTNPLLRSVPRFSTPLGRTAPLAAVASTPPASLLRSSPASPA